MPFFPGSRIITCMETIRNTQEKRAKGYGVRLKRMREKRGLLQRQLAELAGVDQSTISHLENELHKPRGTTMQGLAHALNVEVEKLIP
jgi:transcriptional regulator with XRE-family HTH domain